MCKNVAAENRKLKEQLEEIETNNSLTRMNTEKKKNDEVPEHSEDDDSQEQPKDKNEPTK